jgi:hypothetical protein
VEHVSGDNGKLCLTGSDNGNDHEAEEIIEHNSMVNFAYKHRKHTFSFGLNDPHAPQAQSYNV